MEILETINSAQEALRINKLRSFLTSLGIIIGVAAIILLISIGSGLQSCISAQFEKLGTNTIFILPGKVQFGPQGGPPRAVNKFTFKLAEKLEKEKSEAIIDIAPFIEINITATYRNKSKVTTLAGTRSTYFSIFDIKTESGRPFSEKDNQTSRKVAVIGKTLASDLYSAQDPIGQTISLSKKSFTVIGVLEPQGNVGGVDVDNQAIIPLNSARALTGSEDRKSTRLNSSHSSISYAVFCLKKK